MRRISLLVSVLAVLIAACGDSAGTTTSAGPPATATTTTAITDTGTESDSPEPGATGSFVADVWADNWFALYANGVKVGEDSVPITTERSFNREAISFDAAYPLTIAIEAKDFREDDSGLEYIGTDRQQMGDGGIIAQITDTSTGRIVLVTGDAWSALVIHEAPLNKDCEKSSDPTADCISEIGEPPAGWTEVGFDDTAWEAATVWTEAEVGPKDGYDEVQWEPAAALIWGADLEADNTVLLRATATD